MKTVLITIIIILLGVVGFILYQGLLASSSGSSGESLDPFQEPIQTMLDSATPIIYKKGNLNLIYHPVADYSITARILSKRRYSGDWSAKIAKYDFALGWGNMADSKLLKNISIKQMMRFYFYQTKPGCGLSLDYISKHSANNHLIPANKTVKKALARLRKNDVAQFDGKLIKLSGWYKKGNVSWGTSTTRDDTGDGACELIYVDKVIHDGRVYQ